MSEKIVEYIKGTDLDTLTFWNKPSVVKTLFNLKYVKQWQFNKLSVYIKHGVENADSYGLILYAPNKLYQSLRPITDMSIFMGPSNKSIRKNKIVNNNIIINDERWNVIPVTRYAAGMSRGLYNVEPGSDDFYCGTFYYNEPESKTLLTYKTSRTFFNKTHAMMELDPDWDYTGMMENDPDLFKHMNGELPGDLRLTPQEYYELYSENHYNKHGIHYTNEFIDTLPAIKHYIGKELDLYAEEDEFDQNICIIGKEMGIDIIILTNMIGSHQIVTEVLDTRSRDESFQSLVSIID